MKVYCYCYWIEYYLQCMQIDVIWQDAKGSFPCFPHCRHTHMHTNTTDRFTLRLKTSLSQWVIPHPSAYHLAIISSRFIALYKRAAWLRFENSPSTPFSPSCGKANFWKLVSEPEFGGGGIFLIYTIALHATSPSTTMTAGLLILRVHNFSKFWIPNTFEDCMLCS